MRQLSLVVMLLLILHSGITECKFPFLIDASDATLYDNYDYIIIGGGASGCPLAATLSQAFKVLLLERGGSPYGNPLLMRQENFFLGMLDPQNSQTFVSTEGVENTRARVLGGATSMNGGFYDRASSSEISSMGLDQGKVRAAYEWVENEIVSIPSLGPFQTGFRSGLLEVGVVPDNGATYDHHVGTKTGGVIFDKNGTRKPASDLLSYANSSNIQVLLHAVATRIIFSETRSTPRAQAVEFRDKLGVTHVVPLSNKNSSEIIISAGAIGSPQLLLLSGIGPRQHLQEMNITEIVNLQGVGKYIADNPSTRIFVPSPSPVEVSLVQVAGITSFGSYIESISGPQNLQLGVIFQKVYGPQSTGLVCLLTRDVNDNPSVTFNYYKDSKDLDICVAGANKVEELMLSKSFESFRFGVQPLPSGGTILLPNRRNPLLQASINDTLRSYCKHNVYTMWHYHGSCRVGKVVNSKFQVLGVLGLRIIDGSVFDVCPGTNPQATFMMFGRYMGLQIMEER